MNKLIVFDIDGTLIHTSHLEDKFYLKALFHALGEEFSLNTDWPSYQYSTDAGVFFEIIQQNFNRAPLTQEIQKAQTLFVQLLSEAVSQDKSIYNALPGARDIFKLIKQVGWDVAIATGCWQPSAELKLNNAGIEVEHIPIATSSDHFDRKDIITTSIERAKSFYQKNEYAKIIYVGDRPWDKKATESLGIHFIGIGEYWNNFEQADFVRAKDYTCGTILNYLSS